MIYLDNNATTALSPRALEGMLPYLKDRWGNPSSGHAMGRAARQAIDEARQRVAAAVGAHPTEIIFTSGGTEASNLFLQGIVAGAPPQHIAISAVEHPSVAMAAKALVSHGHKVTVLPVDDQGRLDEDFFASIIKQKPFVVSVLWAHNENGVVQNIPALAQMARAAGVIFHSDAVQALGKIAVDFRKSGLHGLSISGHKVHGPKGSGALIVDKSLSLVPLQFGGGHERGLRSGTENVAAIVGFGLACEEVAANLVERSQKMTMLRKELENGLRTLPQVHIFSSEVAERLPNTTFFALPPLDGATLVGQLDRRGYGVASGSACSSTNPKPSANLLAMGVNESLARCAVRVSLSADNTISEVRDFVSILSETYHRLCGLTAVATTGA